MFCFQPAHEATNFLEGSKYVTADRSMALMVALYHEYKEKDSIKVPKEATKATREADQQYDEVLVTRLVPFVQKQRSIMARELKERCVPM